MTKIESFQRMNLIIIIASYDHIIWIVKLLMTSIHN